MGKEYEWDYCIGRIGINCKAYDTGCGLVVVVTGGDKPHIGSVAVAFVGTKAEGEEPDISETVIPTHMDQHLSTPIARELSKRLQIPVAVVAGIHVDGITKEEITQILSYADVIVESVSGLYHTKL
jgi:hypothetical protein